MDFGTYGVIIILAFLSGMTTLIGVSLAYLTKTRRNLIVIGIGFSTGIMVLVSAFELVPVALQNGSFFSVATAVLAGIFLAVLANHLVPHSHLIKEEHKHKRIALRAAYLIAAGLILHDLPEGFAMANSYIYAPSLGIMVAIAIALHNIPEEFAMAMPLIAAGEKKKRIYKIAFLSGLAEPAGALIGLFAIQFFIGLNAWLMAFAAGIMVYVAIHELWPMARSYEKPCYLPVGILLSLIVYLVLTYAVPK